VLSEVLMDDGHEVVGVDRQANERSSRVEEATHRVDLTSPDALAPLGPADVVVHLAANARVHDLVVEPRGALENLTSTFEALEYARRRRAFFVFASSREVYGNQGRFRYREGDVNPSVVESPYAASKLGGEALVRSYGAVYGAEWSIVRFSNVYGRNDTSLRFVPQAFRCALSGRALTLYGAEKLLDFTYIDDAIDGLRALLGHLDAASGRTFNIAGGKARTLAEAAELVSRVVERPLAIEYGQPRPGEVTSYEADLGEARRLLGYEPRVDLEAGLLRAAGWYVEHLQPARPESA